jgi:hypothetical protein
MATGQPRHSPQLPLLFTRRWRQAGLYSALMIAAGICLIPLFFAISSQLSANTGGYQESRSLVEGVRYLWHHCLTFLLPTELFPNEELSTLDDTRRWLIAVLAIGAAIWCLVSRKHLSERTLSFFIVTLSTFSLLLFAYFLLGGAYIEIRHAAVVFIPLVCFAASLIDDLGNSLDPGLRRAILAAGALIVMISFTWAHLLLFPGMAKRGDWARVADYIQQNESSGQPILIFTVFDAPALPYHYQGHNQVLPREKFNDFGLEAELGTPGSLSRQTEFLISQIPGDASEIWLAVNEKCLVTEACLPLENYLVENYTIQKEQQFYLEKVFLLRKKTK